MFNTSGLELNHGDRRASLRVGGICGEAAIRSRPDRAVAQALNRSGWTVLLAIKSLPEAKSRLRRSELDDASHASIVQAMRADTRATLAAAAGVARVVTIADRAGGEHTLVQSTPGLNAALSEAGAYARSRWPGDGIVALVADLPALRPG